MSFRISCAAVLSVALSIACRADEPKQEDAKPAATPAPDAANAAKSKEAEAVLNEAIEAQHAGDLAATVSDVEFACLFTQRTDKGRHSVDVEQRFKTPDKLWRHVTDTVLGTSVVEGFDGKSGWNKKEKDKLIRFDGPDWKADREKLDTDVRQMRLLLRFFFVENLADALESAERVEDRVVARDNQPATTCAVIRGKAALSDDDGGPCRVELCFDQATHFLVAARIERDDAEPRVARFEFAFHAPTRQDVIVPGNVKEFIGDEKEPSIVIALQSEDVEVDGKTVAMNSIRFNVGMDDASFAPPSSK